MSYPQWYPGDVVAFQSPYPAGRNTAERLVVAWCDPVEGRFAWIGWPDGSTSMSGYVRVAVATPAQRYATIQLILQSGPQDGNFGRYVGVRRCHPELCLTLSEAADVLMGLPTEEQRRRMHQQLLGEVQTALTEGRLLSVGLSAEGDPNYCTHYTFAIRGNVTPGRR